MMNCNYTARKLYISMSDYVKYKLQKFQQPTPTRPQNFPHQQKAPDYGSTEPQLAHSSDDYPALNPDESRNVQQVVGGIFVLCMQSQPDHDSNTEHH